MQRTIPTIFLVFAVLFATAGTSWGQEVTVDDLVEREGLYYQKSTSVPFTGVTTGLVKATYKNGIRHGPWFTYWDNGQLRENGNYNDGNLDGLWMRYHKNGRLSERGNYTNDKIDGPWGGFYDNSQLRFRGNYINGKRDGPWEEYSRDGVLKGAVSGTYRNGVKASD